MYQSSQVAAYGSDLPLAYSPLAPKGAQSSTRFLNIPRSSPTAGGTSRGVSSEVRRYEYSSYGGAADAMSYVGGDAASYVGGASYASGVSNVSNATSVLSERVTEHLIKVPKKIVREEVFEKTIVIPERRIVEDVIEEERVMREKIVEIAKPVYKERVVEVPEIEYRDRIVEVPEVIVQERIHQVPKVQLVERVQQVPKIIKTEKIVEVPQVQYHEVPVIKLVEDVQVRDEYVVKHRPVPQYVDKPVPEYRDKIQHVHIPVAVPKPVAVDLTYQYEVPQIEPIVQVRTFPLYVPKFVEVPFARPCIDPALAQHVASLQTQMQILNSNQVSITEADHLAHAIRTSNLIPQLESQSRTPKILMQNFQNNQVTLHDVAYYSHEKFLRKMQLANFPQEYYKQDNVGQSRARYSRRSRRATKRSKSHYTYHGQNFWAAQCDLARQALPWNRDRAAKRRGPTDFPEMSPGYSEAAIMRGGASSVASASGGVHVNSAAASLTGWQSTPTTRQPPLRHKSGRRRYSSGSESPSVTSSSTSSSYHDATHSYMMAARQHGRMPRGVVWA